MKGTATEHLKAVRMLDPDDHGNSAPTTVIIDTKGFDELEVVWDVGVMAGTSIACKIQEGAESDLSDAADITDAAFTTVTTANDDATYVGRINLRGRDRYIRAAFTFTAVTQSKMGMIGVLSEAKIKPVTQLNTVAFSV